MCTRTDTIIYVYDIISCHMFITYLIPENTPINCFIFTLLTQLIMSIGQCFINKIVPTRRIPSNGEFLPRSSPFPLEVFFFFTSTYGTSVIWPTTNEWWCCYHITLVLPSLFDRRSMLLYRKDILSSYVKSYYINISIF